MDADSVRRRRVLGCGATLLALGLAGCSGGGSSTDSPGAPGGSETTDGPGTSDGGTPGQGTADGASGLRESSAFPGEVVTDQLSAVRPLSHGAHSNGNVEFTFENVDSNGIQVWDSLYEYYIDVRWFDGSGTRLEDPDLFKVPQDARLSTPTPAPETTADSNAATTAASGTAASGTAAGDGWAEEPAVALDGGATLTATAKAPDVPTSELDSYEIAFLRDNVV